MNAKRKITAVLAIAVTSLFMAACDLGDVKDFLAKKGGNDESYYKFLVVSQGDQVSGYYIIDGDYTPIESSDLVLDGTSTYKFEKNLTDPTSITIQIGGTVGGATSCDIYIYGDNKVIKEGHDSVTATGDVVSLNIYYDFTTTESTSSNIFMSPEQLSEPTLDTAPVEPKTQDEIDKELIEQNKDLILF